MLRDGTGKLRLDVVLNAGLVAVVLAGGVVLLTRHHSTGAAGPNPVHTGPSPTPARPSTPTSPPAPTSTATSPPTGTVPASPTPRTPSASTPATAQGIRLVAGPYGFPIPDGWSVSPPAVNGDVRRVQVKNPAGPGHIDYLQAHTSAIYTPDHLVNLQAVSAAVTCTATSTTLVPNRGPQYLCAPEGGLNVKGQILIEPYPNGFRLLQVTMLPEDDPFATQILSQFHL
jgi:hypothetical protein